MAKIRGTHSSPGVYTQFTDISYAAQSLGITKLALVGETKKGPAFDPIHVSDWSEFEAKFGGTSPEKFRDSQYPKYELPYIAKSYLSASNQLYVSRVLGLSGYNAGPAFVITATDSGNTNQYVIAVLRSRGRYYKYGKGVDACVTGETSDYDTLVFDCDFVQLSGIVNPGQRSCGEDSQATKENGIPVNSANLGRFKITCNSSATGSSAKFATVSLNPGSKDYIYDVIGGSPSDAEFPVYVEELYDLRLQELIDKGEVTRINTIVYRYNESNLNAICNPVSDFVTIPYYELTKKNTGQTFLAMEKYDIATGLCYWTESDPENCMVPGQVYIVKEVIDNNGKISYVYVPLEDNNGQLVKLDIPTYSGIVNNVEVVKVLSDGQLYQAYGTNNNNIVIDVTSNFSDYHEMYRCATTPWIVSEAKGDAANIDVKKLFRFHTISDGTSANSMIKISVANIRPDDGLFDIVIRDFNDTDASPIVLESFKNLTMMPGTPNYIGLKIGTLDGAYEPMSNYVLAEIIESELTKSCVPCGFLGYPTRNYITPDYPNSSSTFNNPTITYNVVFDEDIKTKKQYFGMSDITGVDVDMLYYKGKNAYTETYTNGYTKSFHLDSTLSKVGLSNIGVQAKFTVDGDPNTIGIEWETVSPDFNPNKYTHGPVISTEAEMEGCLYEDKNTRKFTVYPCGGFDGWDPYRGMRTNTNEYQYNKYKGSIVNGMGKTFSRVDGADVLNLPSKSITSDYYAYLAGINQFEDPERYVINLFATPGIDYVNNTALVDETLEMLEEKRGDSLYVVTTPDRPASPSESIDDIYTSTDAVDNLESAGIDTYYACTYYPWVKYYDADNSVYIHLPATKDALRNMADVDNKRYPWYAPAGIERGTVVCKKMRYFAKIDDEDILYDGNINPLKTFSEDGVKIWGNKTMYTGNTPMDRINVVRLMLYMRKLIADACRLLIFEPNDTTLKDQFEGIIKPILTQIKNDRGITNFFVKTSQTIEQIDAHEMSAVIGVKPSPTLEYLEINFQVYPQGVEFEEIQ